MEEKNWIPPKSFILSRKRIYLPILLLGLLFALLALCSNQIFSNIVVANRFLYLVGTVGLVGIVVGAVWQGVELSRHNRSLKIKSAGYKEQLEIDHVESVSLRFSHQKGYYVFCKPRERGENSELLRSVLLCDDPAKERPNLKMTVYWSEDRKKYFLDPDISVRQYDGQKEIGKKF